MSNFDNRNDGNPANPVWDEDPMSFQSGGEPLDDFAQGSFHVSTRKVETVQPVSESVQHSIFDNMTSDPQRRRRGSRQNISQESGPQEFAFRNQPVQQSNNFEEDFQFQLRKKDNEIPLDQNLGNFHKNDFGFNLHTDQEPNQTSHPVRSDSVTPPEPPHQKPQSDNEEEEPPKKGSIWVPILVVLILLLVILSGIFLPDWSSKRQDSGFIGKAANTLYPIQRKVLELIGKKSEPITSFHVSCNSQVAPADFTFMITTDRYVRQLSILDNQGRNIYVGVPGDPENTVLEGLLYWNIPYTMEEAYNGSFTCFVINEEGERSEMQVSSAFVIEEPEIVLDPILSFDCSPSVVSVLPSDVRFTVCTNTKVSAIRIVDDQSVAVATVDLDGNAQVTDNGDGSLTWIFSTFYSNNYSGNLYVQYREADSLSFLSSNFEYKVQLGSDPIPTDTPVPIPTETPVIEVTPKLTEVPTPTPTVVPTPTPTAIPTPTPEPTPKPTATPLPSFTAEANESALPENLKLKETVYSGAIGNTLKTLKSYSRTKPINILYSSLRAEEGAEYALWRQAGVLTFRGSSLRQNAASGLAESTSGNMSILWSHPIGSMKVKDGTVVGVTAPGQPLIVKWPISLRKAIGLNEDAKNEESLKEVIISAQDGKVYFYCLNNGNEARPAIDLGAPSRGGLSLDTTGAPILGVGQYNAKLAKKTVKNGYHLISLQTNSKLALLPGDGDESFTNYSGFNGAAAFDKATGTMVVAGLNGVLYSCELGMPNDGVYSTVTQKLNPNSGYQAYKALASGQDKSDTLVEGSVAVYNGYAYYGDSAGILHCVDLNTMKAVWAVNLGEKITSTPALSVNDEGVRLYIGTEKLKAKGTCGIYCFNALSGEQLWKYDLTDQITFVKKKNNGVAASPVVCDYDMSDRVIFTWTGDGMATVGAFRTDSGKLIWRTNLSAPSISSPISIQTEEGQNWIFQAQENGNVLLLETKSGNIVSTLDLPPFTEGEQVVIKASPAAYRDIVIIGTTGAKEGGVYAIKIK